MGLLPVGVESVSELLFQGPALRGWWPVTPSPPYLRPSKDPVYSSQLNGMGMLLRWNVPYKFCPGLGLNPGPQRDSSVCIIGATLHAPDKPSSKRVHYVITLRYTQRFFHFQLFFLFVFVLGRAVD